MTEGLPLEPLPARYQHRKALVQKPTALSSSKPFLITGLVQLVPLDWTSASDPANPQNWCTASKIYHTIIPALFTFVVVLATSTYVPAIPFVQYDFHVSHPQAVLGLSLYMLGVTIGSTFGGPISEVRGRKLVYLVSLPILIGFSIAAASTQSFAILLVSRFIGGLGGSLCIPVGGIFASLLYILMPFLAPALGPLIGAYIIRDRNDWRWSLWIIAIIGAPIYFAAVFMKETSKDEILRARCGLTGQEDQPLSGPKARQVIWIMVSRTLAMLIFEPIVFVLAVYTSFGFAIIFIFFEIFPVIFATIYGFSDADVSLTFMALLIGFLFAIINFAIFAAIVAKRAAPVDETPERHLHCALLGSIMLPASLFWLAFSCKKEVHWIVPILAGIPFGWSTLNIFLSALLYIMVTYPPRVTASAMAALGVLRYTFGTVFPLFANQMVATLDVKWSFVLLGGIASTMLPAPWLLLRYGQRLRIKSKWTSTR